LIKDKKILGIIPARGGSKGLSGKNLRLLGGRSLLSWTIEEAKKSKFLDRLIVSSEDDEIIKAAKELDCDVPFVRPEELSRDNSPGIDPVLHALRVLPEKYEYVVLLQVTSPLRTAGDIDQCLKYCLEKEAPACVSVAPAAKSPYWMYSLGEEGKIKPLIDTGKNIYRRQDLPSAYVLNGAIYCAKVDWLLKKKNFISGDTIVYVMPPERSLDIDSELDLQICEYLLTRRNV